MADGGLELRPLRQRAPGEANGNAVLTDDDVLGPERRTEGGDLIGDPWEYDVDCGITLTADEVSALLG